MHPILVKRSRLAFYLTAWFPVIGLIAALLHLSGLLSWTEALVLAIPLGVCHAFLCLSSWYLCRTFPFQETRILRLLAIFTIASLFANSIWIFLGKGLAAALALLPMFHELNARYHQQAPILFGVGVLLFLLMASVHFLLASFESSRENERRNLEVKILAREAELKSLRAQINPHFLFNCLNSISALTTADPAKAREMCLLLADFLRMSLDFGSRDFISLEEEISLITQFLAVEQVRLGSRLTVERNFDPQVGSCAIPPLLLQPLVENAVRHGIAQLPEGGTIRIDIERRGERLRIVVENPFDPEAPPGRGKGIGLRNVRQRLQTMFGAEARMDMQKNANLYRVEISFPAESAK
jgi:two-component system sensor histidine kinase AlgZ